MSKVYSFTNTAEKVLEQFGDKKPMHYKAITEKALSLNWIETQGKTPEATMYAQILNETKRYMKRGDQPRFVIYFVVDRQSILYEIWKIEEIWPRFSGSRELR